MPVEQYYLMERAERLTIDESGKYKPTFYVRYRDDLGKVHEQSTGETSKVRARLLSSAILGSIWQAMVAAILGVGHITNSIRESQRLETFDAGRHQVSPDQA